MFSTSQRGSIMYQYFDLDDSRFENLAIAICKEILGNGVQGFSKGADGGKDGEFNGIANLHPSQSAPWQGITIIQAKHTTGVNKHFTDSDFHGNNSCILAKEVEKIKEMVDKNQIDHYILFANRSLTGGAKPIIQKYISDNTGLAIDDITVLGNDDLDYYLARYQFIVDMSNIDLQPLNHAPALDLNNLAEVIGHFSDVFNDKDCHKDFLPVVRTSYQEKNILNNLRNDTAKQLERNYMKYVYQIKDFLNDPQNKRLQDCYQESIEEFQLQYIIPKQRELDYFDDIFNELVKYLREKDYILRKNIRLTRIIVFYMYWNCDIGKSNYDNPSK